MIEYFDIKNKHHFRYIFKSYIYDFIIVKCEKCYIIFTCYAFAMTTESINKVEMSKIFFHIWIEARSRQIRIYNCN